MVTTASFARAQDGALTLQQAIDIAQRQGIGAEIAARARDAARERDRAFNARLLPQLSLTGTTPNYNRAIIPVLQPDGSTVFAPQQQTDAGVAMQLSQKIPVTGGDLLVSSSLDRLDVAGNRAFRSWSSTPYSIGIRQDLLRPTALRFDGREQALRAESAEQSYLEAREDVALQTSGAFFTLYSAQMTLANATANAAVNDTLYRINTGRFAVGKIGENDLLQSELALLRARNALAGARLDVERARGALRLVLNMRPREPLEIVVTSVVPDVNADTAVAITEALRRRSQLADVAAQDVGARRRLSEARWGNGLSAVLQANVGVNATGPAAADVYRNLRDQQRLSLFLSVPIFQWGARSADIQAAVADLERIQLSARGLREATAQEAYFAVLTLDQARSQLALAAKADTVAAKRFEVAYNRYVIGRIGVDNLFVAQSEKDAALQSFVQSLRNFWESYYRLRRITLFDFVTQRPLR